MQSENTAGAEAIEETGTDPGLVNLGEMLELDEPAEDAGNDSGESDGESGSDKTPLKKFNDLAGKLEVELEDLYKLEISQADDGTPVTIENLKDYYAKQTDIEMREVEFEERKTEAEAKMMQAQEELREIMAALPEKAIKPEVLAKVREKHAAQIKLERAKTLEVIPEWTDEKTRESDMTGMAEHLKQYGYPVDHLGRVADHRQVKYIRDNWQREERIRKALAAVRAGKPNPTKPSKPSGKAPSKNPLAGVKRGNARNKLEAVFSNID